MPMMMQLMMVVTMMVMLMMAMKVAMMMMMRMIIGVSSSGRPAGKSVVGRLRLRRDSASGGLVKEMVWVTLMMVVLMLVVMLVVMMMKWKMMMMMVMVMMVMMMMELCVWGQTVGQGVGAAIFWEGTLGEGRPRVKQAGN